MTDGMVPTSVLGRHGAVSAMHSRLRGLRTRLLRHVWLSVTLALLAVACLGTGAVSAYSTLQTYRAMYQRDMARARDGVQQLSLAKGLAPRLMQNPFDSVARSQACSSFQRANTDFGLIQHDLEGIPAGVSQIPHYGQMVQAARRLVPIASDVSQAGSIGCDALNLVSSRLSNPLQNSGKGMTTQDLATIRSYISQIAALLRNVSGDLRQLQPSDLTFDSRSAVWLSDMQAELPGLQNAIGTATTLLQSAPVLLGIGQPANYLIEQLDSTELRPGGGFIGTYGIATVSGAGLADLWMTDVDLLDRPYEASGHMIPYPPQYRWFQPLAPHSWSLRDANLDADFPTSARYAEQNYHLEGGTIPLQGVVAITPWLIVNAFKITGPIYVPEYHETITAANLVDRIHYYQLGAHSGPDYIPSPDGHSSLRKRFTSYLFEHFFAVLRQRLPTAMPQFIHLLMNAIQTKDIQIYVNVASAENILRQYNIASAIEAPPGDSLFIVDANVVVNKANDFITYSLRDHITVDGLGVATHHATLTYDWPITAESSRNNYGAASVYRDYLRIYVPPGSVLEGQSSWDFQGASQASGRIAFSGFFTMMYGSSKTITLTWTTPKAATHRARGWQYLYLMQRQAGVTWSYQVTVTLPACDRNSPVLPNTLGSGQAVIAAGPLTHDTTAHADSYCV